LDVKAIEKIVEDMRENPRNIRFDNICKICDYYFGKARTSGSQRIYRTPWQGDPRINIQNDNGKARAHQVRQVLQAIEEVGMLR